MKAGWVLGTLVSIVVVFAGVCQTGLLKCTPVCASQSVSYQDGSTEDLFNTEAGWRYQRGQPSHWKYLVMHCD